MSDNKQRNPNSIYQVVYHERRNYLQNITSSLLLITIIVVTISCVRNNVPAEFYLKSDLEFLTKDNKYFVAYNDSSSSFSGGLYQTTLRHKSGIHSAFSTPKSAFILSTEIAEVYRDSYVDIEVWKQGENAHLVCVLPETKDYFSTSEVVETDTSGWQKLHLTFYLPPVKEYYQLKFYVWNSGKDTVYYDDVSLKVIKNKPFPEYSLPAFYVELDTSAMMSLMETRIKAFKAGILQSSEDGDWVEGFVFADNMDMKAKLRLKGDWLDHLHGSKWSYRVKLKKEFSWNRMKVFSLQNPMARLGVNEWFLHQLMMSEGLLTTRYGFIPMTLNGRNMGLYAWEEHFVKQLVESQNRREGPILRFLENALWDTRVLDDKKMMNNKKTPVFQAAAIEPFASGKIAEDSGMFQQYLIAQNLMYQYKNRLAKASDIFNVEMMAKYFAMADVFLARHSIIWHNQRFYYNPVLCKLEPIAYDCYSDIGLEDQEKNSIWGFQHQDLTQPDEFIMIHELFNDTVFSKSYIHYLTKYSNVDFLDSVFSHYQPKTDYYDSLIKREYPEERFFKSNVLVNAQKIRDLMPAFEKQVNEMKMENRKWKNNPVQNQKYDSVLPAFFAPNLVLAYKQKVAGDSCLLKVKSFFPDKIIVLGVGKTSKKLREIVVPVPDLNGSCNGIPAETSFYVNNEKTNYLFFSITSSDEVFSIEINPWPEPNGAMSPYQELISTFPFPDTSIISKVNGNKVYVKGGKNTIDHPIQIPAGYVVNFEPGTTLDFIKKANFISYSPIIMRGTPDAPVVITSSDFTANGFAVLQAEGRSQVEYARFENLNTLNYKGWVLTGAVTFYESDVDIKHSVVYRNQCEDGLNIIRSQFLTEDVTFDYTWGDAFDSDFSNGLVLNCKFTNLGNDAIDFSGSTITIQNVTIDKASDKGISGGEMSHLTVINNTIKGCNIGIASKDLSVVDVTDTKILDCNYGLVLLQKKPEYGPGTLYFNQSTIQNPQTEMLIEVGSMVIKDGTEISGSVKEASNLFY
ncbi:MAG: hypothetical protein CVT99_06775 [Bacteroidetes bacterium HGW-Bacteroidetes-16]|jgi:hypothetical protein|nr:MAG: hypothetical protein CVT99_06775 [Bacteroidetes bacterium HGW-Bacteroidetes-16]